MKYVLLAIAIVTFTGCAPHARRSFLGSWEETVETRSILSSHAGEMGYFTFTQHQSFFADKLDAANLHLRYTNTTDEYQSFNYRINFQLRTVSMNSHYSTRQTYSDRERRNGYWTYDDAIVRCPPGSSVAIDMISDRIVDIQDGTIQVMIQ